MQTIVNWDFTFFEWVDLPSEIIITWDKFSAIGLFNVTWNTSILLESWSNVEIYHFSKWESLKLDITIKDNSVLKVKSLSVNSNDSNLDLALNLNWNNSESIITTLCLSKSGSSKIFTEVNWISSWYNNKVSMDNETIFIWKSKIITAPILNIKWTWISASHSSKNYKISWVNSFYLNSRWFNEEETKILIVEGYFDKYLRCINWYKSELYERLKKSFLKDIN